MADPWVRLYRSHHALRGAEVVTLETEVRKRLQALAPKHIDGYLAHRWTYKKTGRLLVYDLRDLSVRAIDGLDDVKLSLFAKVDMRSLQVHKFDLLLTGRVDDARSWTAAIHLEDNTHETDADQKGSGAGGHAALHCHVGPDLDAHPSVRVPLPAMPMAQCLDWLLTTVIPTWEPAPWPSVTAALQALDDA